MYIYFTKWIEIWILDCKEDRAKGEQGRFEGVAARKFGIVHANDPEYLSPL